MKRKTKLKWALGFVIAPTLLAAVTLVLIMLSGNALAAEEWNRWAAAPYATSQEEACKKAPAAIDGFNMPPEVKGRFAEMLGADCQGGVEIWLTPHQPLEQMWSGGAKPHVMNNVTVGELPVLRSPDGRAYHKGTVAETAKALSWEVVHEGKTYVLYIPFVCFNIAWAFGPSSPLLAAVAKCPDVYAINVNVWERAALKLTGIEQTHAKEELGQGRFAGTPHVSSTHGKQLREAYAAGELKRSSVERAFRVSLIMTPESQGSGQTITAEEVLGDVAVIGLRELMFTAKQVNEWDALRLVAVNGDVLSPPRFNGTGLRELRFFFRLPGTKMGEWDNNYSGNCIMNVHFIE